ncbi:MAG: ABC transporter substrate-binding protein [Planctomycetes bacterium]|nr:ABC transporter substrate-binding protein [Planctomycetota bacterium]
MHWFAVLALLVLTACGGSDPAGRDTKVLRVGHFPNVTHAHGVVAHHLSRAGRGWFEARLGPDVRIDWFVFNAGPSAMESLLAGSIDLTYVGPNPALNAHIRSGGEEVRVVAGATFGGAALVVRGDAGIARPEDFRGKKVATPQFGNTQDVVLRAWLLDHGYRITQTGGDVLVLPTHNPDQLALMARGKLDAAWTVEPWVSRLELEAGARVFLEEPDAVTTVLVASARFLARERELVRRFVQAHEELTAWLLAHPDEAQRMLREEILAETRSELPEALVARCWPRLHITSAVTREAFERFLEDAVRTGFLAQPFPLDRFVERP